VSLAISAGGSLSHRVPVTLAVGSLPDPRHFGCRFATAPRHFGCRFAIAPHHFGRRFATAPSVVSTVGSAGTGMEKPPARENRDLSAPWLRHCGRDDGWVAATPIEDDGGEWHSGADDGWVVARHSDCRFAIAPRHFGRRFATAPSVVSTVGSAGTGMEKSPARETRDLFAPWLRHCGRDELCQKSTQA
jgi:hypothetical protein